MIDTVMKKAPLSDGPKSMVPEGGAKGTVDIVMKPAPISKEPVSMVPGGFGPKPEMVMKPAPVSMTPQKGWDQVQGKLSDRSVKQSK